MSVKINGKNLIYLQIIYNCFAKYLIVDLGLPSLLNYVTDLITLLLFCVTLKKLNFHIPRRNIAINLSILLLLCMTLSFIVDISSIGLYVWSLRNIFRFYVFFFACIYCLEEQDIIKIFEILEKILIINFAICGYEYFIEGMNYDFLGGSFGNGVAGGNGPLNLLMIIVSGYVLIQYVYKNKSLREVLGIIVGCLAIAAVAELKVYFFEIIIAVIFVVGFVKHDLKMLATVFLLCCFGLAAIGVYNKLYPNNAGFLSSEYIIDYVLTRTYGSSTDINRLTAISIISDRCFQGRLKPTWFGLGLGNGTTAQFGFLKSPFYLQYGDRLKYTWFTHAYMFVEGGYVGLVLYFAFFVSIAVKALVQSKNNMIMQLCLFCTLFSIIMVVYNQTMQVETMGYTMFALLAIPYIQVHSRTRKEKDEEKSCDNYT